MSLALVALLILAWFAASAVHARFTPTKGDLERRKRRLEERRAAARRSRTRITDEDTR